LRNQCSEECILVYYLCPCNIYQIGRFFHYTKFRLVVEVKSMSSGPRIADLLPHQTKSAQLNICIR
jgi:hypothetical protein